MENHFSDLQRFGEQLLLSTLQHRYNPDGLINKYDQLIFPDSFFAGYPRPTSPRTLTDLRAETLVRTWMLAAPVLYVNPNLISDGRYAFTYLRNQLAMHVDPEHPLYLAFDNRHEPSQLTVEAAMLALIILEMDLLKAFDQRDRQNIIDWIAQFKSAEVPENNWHWFRLFINVFLQNVGRPVDEWAMKTDLAFIKGALTSNGWFKDGTRYDQYSAWSWQWWPVFYRKYALQAKHNKFFADANEKFLESYSKFFSRTGKNLPWGRSTTYRFAACAPFAVAFNHKCNFDPGFARHIVLSNIKSYDPAKIIKHGTLSLGFKGEGDTQIDSYSCVASPMWACKALWCLFLPQDNPFWAAPDSTGFWGSNSEQWSYSVNGMYIESDGEDITLHYDQDVTHDGGVDYRYIGPFTTKE